MIKKKGAQLKRAEHSAHVSRCVIIHQSEDDGVHKRNHVFGAVGRDAQKHIGSEHVEQKDDIDDTGKVEHGV